MSPVIATFLFIVGSAAVLLVGFVVLDWIITREVTRR